MTKRFNTASMMRILITLRVIKELGGDKNTVAYEKRQKEIDKLMEIKK